MFDICPCLISCAAFGRWIIIVLGKKPVFPTQPTPAHHIRPADKKLYWRDCYSLNANANFDRRCRSPRFHSQEPIDLTFNNRLRTGIAMEKNTKANHTSWQRQWLLDVYGSSCLATHVTFYICGRQGGGEGRSWGMGATEHSSSDSHLKAKNNF